MKPDFPQEGPFELVLPTATPTQPHIPIRAAKALVKAGCSIVPADALPACKNPIAWLLGQATFNIEGFPVLYAFTPGVNPYKTGRAIVLRRKSDIAAPAFWFIVATGNFRFQVVIPCCSGDAWMQRGENTFTINHFPVPFDDSHVKRFGSTKFGVLEWGGTAEQVITPKTTLHVESATCTK